MPQQDTTTTTTAAAAAVAALLSNPLHTRARTDTKRLFVRVACVSSLAPTHHLSCVHNPLLQLSCCASALLLSPRLMR